MGKLVDQLPNTRMSNHIAGQLIRCGTAAAPNYAEGCVAESLKDFIHKLSIALKELREAETWLAMIRCAELLPPAAVAPLQDECDQLCRIVAASVKTAKQKLRRTP